MGGEDRLSNGVGRASSLWPMVAGSRYSFRYGNVLLCPSQSHLCFRLGRSSLSDAVTVHEERFADRTQQRVLCAGAFGQKQSTRSCGFGFLVFIKFFGVLPRGK